MITRNQLTQFLYDTYDYSAYDDFCENGLQVEGKDEIRHIVFGVSFNGLLLDQAVRAGADALIVHHGIFQKGVFTLKGPLKQKVESMLNHGISLYGIHLPMDGHSEIGHSALLLKKIGAQSIEPFDLGYQGSNAAGHSLDAILDIYHRELHPEGFTPPDSVIPGSPFGLTVKHGFSVLPNGPGIPGKIAVVTGGSSGRYESAIEAGCDTFFGGDIKEHTPAISLETGTSFVNLGHYFSEKPGVLALMERIKETGDATVQYIEVPNVI